MKQVTMSHHVFDHVGSMQYVCPTIAWLSGWKLGSFHIKDLEVTFQLDYDRGEYRIQIIDTKSVSVMVDYIVQLPCAESGEQKNVDDIMGLLKITLQNDRRCQCVTAVKQFLRWFDKEVTEWLKTEVTRERYRPYNDTKLDWIIVGD